MKSSHLRLALIVLTLAFILQVSGAGAQEEPAAQPNPSDNKAQFGLGLTMKSPYSSFDDDYGTAYGLTGMLSYPFIPLLDLTASIGWNTFSADGDGESLDIWEFTGGMRFRMGVFFMSGEVGYYTEIEQTSFLPGLGLKFDHFEIAFNIRAVDSGSWRGMRLGYYF